MTGHNRPEGDVWLVDLGVPIEYGVLQPVGYMALYMSQYALGVTFCHMQGW